MIGCKRVASVLQRRLAGTTSVDSCVVYSACSAALLELLDFGIRLNSAGWGPH